MNTPVAFPDVESVHNCIFDHNDPDDDYMMAFSAAKLVGGRTMSPAAAVNAIVGEAGKQFGNIPYVGEPDQVMHRALDIALVVPKCALPATKKWWEW